MNRRDEGRAQFSLVGSSPLNVLIATPTLQAGAADVSTVELVRLLTKAGHRAIVASAGGPLAGDVAAAGGECVLLSMASRNPFAMWRNANRLAALIRERNCHLVHAHGRTAAWSAYAAARRARVPFVATWHKGFREQNVFKRVYNSVMARGDRVIAVSDQLADLVHDRYGTPWDRIAVVPASVDTARFDPSAVTRDRVAEVRKAWGVEPNERVILVVGRMLRRKGHHVMLRAASRLKAMGLKDFVCVIASQEHGTSYAGELWDHVLATGTSDIIRMTGPIADLPAAYAAASVVVSAAVQPEGLQRSLLEAQAMACPVIVSDLAAGPDIVLAEPSVPRDRITGMRFSSGDDAALAGALVRLFSMPVAARKAIGFRGREWVLGHFTPPTISELTLKVYAEAVGRRPAA